jgi:hypothetical protein
MGNFLKTTGRSWQRNSRIEPSPLVHSAHIETEHGARCVVRDATVQSDGEDKGLCLGDIYTDSPI